MVEPVLEPVVVFVVVVVEFLKEIIMSQTIVIAVIMTVSLIFIIIFLFIILILWLSTFLMELDIATLQNTRSAVSVTVREYQTEGVPVAAGLAVVSNNNRVGVGSFTVDLGNAFDLTGHGIDYGVSRNFRALDLHTIVVIE